eukprot:8769693-Pyramimonas_sp.AAC.1
MASSESRKNNREADFVWAFVTVQKRQDNGEWKDAEPGVHGSPKDKCTCDHVRIRPHDRARARAERMERVATLRIAPEPANEEAAAERA